MKLTESQIKSLEWAKNFMNNYEKKEKDQRDKKASNRGWYNRITFMDSDD